MDRRVPHTIVFFGVAGSGKDTLGTAVAEKYKQHRQVSFAEPIKNAVQPIFGFSTEDLFGPSSRRETLYREYELAGVCVDCGYACVPHPERTEREFWLCTNCTLVYPQFITPRLACTSLGTEWGRRLVIDIWSRAITKLKDPVYVTDGRFISEFTGTEGTCRVLLLRNLETSRSRHQSETELQILAEKFRDRFEIVLDNRNCTVEETCAMLFAALEELPRIRTDISSIPAKPPRKGALAWLKTIFGR